MNIHLSEAFSNKVFSVANIWNEPKLSVHQISPSPHQLIPFSSTHRDISPPNTKLSWWPQTAQDKHSSKEDSVPFDWFSLSLSGTQSSISHQNTTAISSNWEEHQQMIWMFCFLLYLTFLRYFCGLLMYLIMANPVIYFLIKTMTFIVHFNVVVLGISHSTAGSA